MMTPNEHDPKLSSISHDIKSPLTTVQMTLHLLIDQTVGELNEAQMKLASKAKEDCDRIVALVEQHFDRPE